MAVILRGSDCLKEISRALRGELFLTTLGSMSSSTRLAQVVDLATVRRFPHRHLEREVHSEQPRTRKTVVLSVSMSTVGQDVIRHIGVDDSKTLGELHSVLDISLGLEQEDPVPWHFEKDGRQIAATECIHLHLNQDDSELEYHWGLWNIAIQVVDVIMRDGLTPTALCVGGMGDVRDEEFDLSRINAQLTGEDVTDTVLANVRPEVSDVIRRSGMYDFVPLLQAVDLGHVSQAVSPRLLELPLEEAGDDSAAHDAFWSSVLGMTCMSDQVLTDSVSVALMTALGWDISDASEIRQLCPDSLAVLEESGAWGAQAKSAVERLDIYRELLRRRSR